MTEPFTTQPPPLHAMNGMVSSGSILAEEPASSQDKRAAFDCIHARTCRCR
jgi:hypothetical protein